MFEVDYKIIIKNDKNSVYSLKKVHGKTTSVDDIEGVAMWFVNHEPQQTDMRTAFGYKTDFNGLGVFLFKHDGTWRI
jgi:hypothetical protein